MYVLQRPGYHVHAISRQAMQKGKRAKKLYTQQPHPSKKYFKIINHNNSYSHLPWFTMKEEEEKVAKGRVASECLECVKNQTSVWSISHTKYTLNWADPPAGSHYTLLY